MPETKNDVPHLVGSGSFHPAIEMAAHLAQRLHAARCGPISKSEFEGLFHSASANGEWRDHAINLRTAALMVAAALQVGVHLEQRAALNAAKSPDDPALAQTNEHAALTMATVASLSTLVDEFGASPRL